MILLLSRSTASALCRSQLLHSPTRSVGLCSCTLPNTAVPGASTLSRNNHHELLMQVYTIHLWLKWKQLFSLDPSYRSCPQTLSGQLKTKEIWIQIRSGGRRRRRRVALGLCASVLAPSSSDNWVVAMRRCRSRPTTTEYKHDPTIIATLLPHECLCTIGINLHCSLQVKQSS